jgi:hypothetical protein
LEEEKEDAQAFFFSTKKELLNEAALLLEGLFLLQDLTSA